jgi:hypothetical protein
LKHDFLSYLAVPKIDTYIAKQCSHVEFPYFVMGSYLGSTAQATLVGVKIEHNQVICNPKLGWCNGPQFRQNWGLKKKQE